MTTTLLPLARQPRSWTAALLAVLATSAAVAAPVYHVVDLGSLGNDAKSYANGLGARGAVVGHVLKGRNAVSRPVRYVHHMPVDLITETGADASEGTANGVNRRGDVAGGMLMGDGLRRPFVYRQGVLEVVQVPSGRPAWANALSDRNHLLVVGPTDDGGFCRMCSSVRLPDGTWSALQRWRDGEFAVGEAINRNGTVVGWADPARSKGPRRAIVWRNETPHLVPGTEDSPSATALAINDAGDITGIYEVGGRKHAFVVRAGQLIDLETDPNADSEGHGLDNHGRVVGHRLVGGHANAFLAEDGQLLALDDLVEPAQKGQWRIYTAAGINDAGEIIAQGLSLERKTHALKLVPVPSR